MKKVLIITYYWPPAGGISVLRCLKFAKYLRKFDWEPIVYTVKDPIYQYYDYNNEKDIPKGIEILKQRSTDPTNFFKKISGRKKEEPLLNIVQASSKKRTIIDTLGIWIRGNFFIPDARALWIKPSVSYLEKYLKKNPVDAVLTDGPPHTNTVIGLRISQKLNIPWLADFQDPWTQADYYEKMLVGKLADRKHKALEQAVFEAANKITIASPQWKRDLEKIGAKDVDVIYYGYDEDDFSGFKKRRTNQFKIFHAGLLGNDRNPEILFETIQDLILENPSLKDKLKLSFAGEVDYEVIHSVEKNKISGITEFLGMIDRKAVFRHYEEASLLILPVNKARNAVGRIPGKLYEYMRAFTPILAFGPEKSDVKNIIEGKKIGFLFTYNDKEGLKNYLKMIINDFLKGNIVEVVSEIEEFSNENQTKKIAGFLNDILLRN